MSTELSISQRVMGAARLVNTTNGGNRVSVDPNSVNVKAAAVRLGVSERSVRSGRLLLQHGSNELVEAVDRGEISVFTACKKVVSPKRKTRDPDDKCVRCRIHRSEIERLKDQLADMTAERNKYYVELETFRETIAPANPVASAIQTS